MPSEPIVETVSGKLGGSTQAGIHAFKGIPYGASTAGANRFQPPRLPEPWTGMRDPLSLGGRAPQWQGAPPRRPATDTWLGPVDTSPETEECLNLHVWTPSLDGGKRAVMVWLHGGAFHFGSANRAVTDGANLARRGDVVVVAVNHRLNTLGHLDLAANSGEGYAHSGNTGVLDLVAALAGISRSLANPVGAAKSACCSRCRKRTACSTAPSSRAARRFASRPASAARRSPRPPCSSSALRALHSTSCRYRK